MHPPFSRAVPIPPPGQISNGIEHYIGPNCTLEIARTELFSPDQVALQAGSLSTLQIGVDVVADHENLVSGKPQFPDRRRKERSGGLAEYERLAPGCMFQGNDKRCSIQ